MLVLKSDSCEPVGKPVSLCLARQRVGRVVETIGAVKDPFYLAVVEGERAKQLVGKTLAACKGAE